jgi:hypothetical protein
MRSVHAYVSPRHGTDITNNISHPNPKDSKIRQLTMSALGLFRSRTTQAFASASNPPIAMQLAFHPRHMSRLRLPITRTSKTIKLLEMQIGAIMASPRLDEQQKYRASKRICAEIDFQTTFRGAIAQQQKAFDSIHHLKGLSLEARDDFYKRVVKGLLHGCLALRRKLSTRL